MPTSSIRYIQLSTSFWREPDIRKWSSDAKVLYLYLIGNNDVHGATGIGHIDLSAMCFDLNMEPKNLAKAKAEIGDKVQWFSGDYYWVKARSAHACYKINGDHSDKLARAAANYVSGLRSDILDAYVKRYPDILAYAERQKAATDAQQIPHTKGIDTPSIGHARGIDTPSIDHRYPIDTLSTTSCMPDTKPKEATQDKRDTPSIPHRYPMHTPSLRESDSDSESESESESDNGEKNPPSPHGTEAPPSRPIKTELQQAFPDPIMAQAVQELLAKYASTIRADDSLDKALWPIKHILRSGTTNITDLHTAVERAAQTYHGQDETFNPTAHNFFRDNRWRFYLSKGWKPPIPKEDKRIAKIREAAEKARESF